MAGNEPVACGPVVRHVGLEESASASKPKYLARTPMSRCRLRRRSPPPSLAVECTDRYAAPRTTSPFIHRPLMTLPTPQSDGPTSADPSKISDALKSLLTLGIKSSLVLGVWSLATWLVPSRWWLGYGLNPGYVHAACLVSGMLSSAILAVEVCFGIREWLAQRRSSDFNLAYKKLTPPARFGLAWCAAHYREGVPLGCLNELTVREMGRLGVLDPADIKYSHVFTPLTPTNPKTSFAVMRLTDLGIAIVTDNGARATMAIHFPELPWNAAPSNPADSDG